MRSFFSKNRAIFIFLLLASFAEVVCAEPFEKPHLIAPEVVLPSTSGLGGIYSTYQRNLSLLFSNPALYPFAQKKITITALNVRTDVLAFQALSHIKEKDRDAKLIELLSTTKSLCTNAALTGPVSFAFVEQNFALGVFNTTKATFFLPSLSHFYAIIGEDVYITGGYGGVVYQDENHVISLGFNMKGFLQTYAYIIGTVFNSSLTLYRKKLEGLPIVLQAGFGLDVGFIYKYTDSFTFGATLKDVYTPVFLSYYENYKDFLNSKKTGGISYKTFLPNLTIGCSIQAFPLDHFKNVHALTFYFDWRDVFSFIPSVRRNYLLNFAFGAELILHRVLSLRFGVSELYPQVGLGLDFTYFNLDFSVYMRELSLSLWQRPLINIEMGMRFDI